MKRRNKILLGAAGVSSLFIPLFAGKCKDTKTPKKPRNREDDGFSEYANDGKQLWIPDVSSLPKDHPIKLGTTFGEGKPQDVAMSKIVEMYNETQKDKEGFKRVEIVKLGSGYGQGADKVNSAINNKTIKDLVNLTLNYAPVAVNLAQKNLLLNFRSKDEKFDVNTRDLFSEDFVAQNETSEYIMKKGTWILPGLKSSHAMGINTPVMSYVLETLKELGATIDESFQKHYDEIVKFGKNDREYVKKLWGDVITDKTKLEDLKIKDLIIKESTFQSLSEFLDFATISMQLFKNSNFEENPIASSGLYFLCVDDMAGFIQAIGFSAVNADPEKHFMEITINKDGFKQVSYDGFTKEDNDSFKQMNEIYNKIIKAMEVGALSLKGGGEYTSTDQTKHRVAVGIGSSAGYSYNFIQEGDKAVVYCNDGQPDLELDSAEFIPFAVVEKKDKDGKVLEPKRIGITKYNNKIHESQITHKYDYYAASKEDWDAVSSPKTIEAAEKFVKANKDAKDKDPKAENVYEAVLIKKMDKRYKMIEELSTSNPDEALKIADIKKCETNDEFGLYIVKREEFKRKEIGDERVLNQDEFYSMSPLSKWVDTNKKHVTYIQGPSLMGISFADEEYDNATRLFAKFLCDTETKYEYPNGKMTTAKYLSVGASYIFPLKGLEEKDFASIKNGYIQVAARGFENANKDPQHYTTYEEYAGVNSNKFRDALNSVYISVYKNIFNGEFNKGDTSYKAKIVDEVEKQCKDFINKK